MFCTHDRLRLRVTKFMSSSKCSFFIQWHSVGRFDWLYSSIHKSHTFHSENCIDFQMKERQNTHFFSLTMLHTVPFDLMLFTQTASPDDFLFYEHSLSLSLSIYTDPMQYYHRQCQNLDWNICAKHFFLFSSLSDIKISKILCISDNRVRKRKFGIYTSLSFRVCECVCVRIDMVRRDCYYILAAIDADICDLFCLLCFYYPCYWLTVWFIARREFNIKPIATFDFCFILCIKHTSDKAPKKNQQTAKYPPIFVFNGGLL